ncbi:hypothetical protein CF326_g8335 [Tilletia indica]|nr:hypothetical protein CF326_g8335 [Tilletia indica]
MHRHLRESCQVGGRSGDGPGEAAAERDTSKSPFITGPYLAPASLVNIGPRGPRSVTTVTSAPSRRWRNRPNAQAKQQSSNSAAASFGSDGIVKRDKNATGFSVNNNDRSFNTTLRGRNTTLRGRW